MFSGKRWQNVTVCPEACGTSSHVKYPKCFNIINETRLSLEVIRNTQVPPNQFPNITKEEIDANVNYNSLMEILTRSGKFLATILFCPRFQTINI